MEIIHDKLQPLGLSRSESSISYNAVIDRTLPISGMRVADTILSDDEEELGLFVSKNIEDKDYI